MPTQVHLLLAVLACLLLPLEAIGAEQARRPNIIVIMADDMGFSDVGCYGGEIQTPNLDRLAAGGVRFTQFYNTSRCCPTRASLLTGLYSHQAGVGHMVESLGPPAYRGSLNQKCVTIPEVLRTVGYRTAMAGKWHLSPLSAGKEGWPLQRGFDKFFGLIGSVRSYYNPPTLTRDNEPIQAGKDFYLTDAISDAAVNYLQDFGRGQDPFFLYVAYTSPHWPMHALEKDIEKYRGKYKAGWDELRKQRHQRLVEMGLVDKNWRLAPRDPEVRAWADEPNQNWQDLRMAVYAAMIDRMDQGIGRILKQVKDSGQEQNTLILFLADNGGCAEEMDASWRSRFPEKTPEGRLTKVGNDPQVAPGPAEVFQSYGRSWANASDTPFRLFKHWVHEGGIATPLIAYWPATIKKPAIAQQAGHVIDILATCLDVAGLEYPKSYRDRAITPLEGKSLLPILQGQSRQGHDAIFWEHEGNRAVRQGKWKLVAQHQGDWELYDLNADRTEIDNLATKLPDRVKELAGLHNRWAEKVGVVSWDKLQKK